MMVTGWQRLPKESEKEEEGREMQEARWRRSEKEEDDLFIGIEETIQRTGQG